MACEWMQPCTLHVVHACECRLPILPNAEHVNINIIYTVTATATATTTASRLHVCIAMIHTIFIIILYSSSWSYTPLWPNMNCVEWSSCMHLWYVQIFRKLMFEIFKTLQKMCFFLVHFFQTCIPFDFIYRLRCVQLLDCLLVWQLGIQCFII